jgi:hypothetical protein
MNDKLGHEWIYSKWNSPESIEVWMVCPNCHCLARFKNGILGHIVILKSIRTCVQRDKIQLAKLTCNEIIVLTVIES